MCVCVCVCVLTGYMYLCICLSTYLRRTRWVMPCVDGLKYDFRDRLWQTQEKVRLTPWAF